MKDGMFSDEDKVFYAEWVIYEDEEEKKRAESYLFSWMYFIYRKVRGRKMREDFDDFTIIVRPNVYGNDQSTIALKFWLKKEER
jgi:uncharacterized protein (DUF1810 family)